MTIMGYISVNRRLTLLYLFWMKTFRYILTLSDCGSHQPIKIMAFMFFSKAPSMDLEGCLLKVQVTRPLTFFNVYLSAMK